jgi:hypothetical protein
MTNLSTELARLAEKATPLSSCPIGLFLCGDELCLKTEYGNNEGRIDAYIVSSGEFFWGDAPQTVASQRAQMVRPVPLLEIAALKAAETPLGVATSKWSTPIPVPDTSATVNTTPPGDYAGPVERMETVKLQCGPRSAEIVQDGLDAITALTRQLAERDAEIAIHECLNVSAYRAGMKAGWSYCDANDLEGYQRAMEGTEHIAELKRLRSALEGTGRALERGEG